LQVLTGTSGFSYKEWKGEFYPEKIKAADMLAFYAERLPAVEINNSFYRMPRESVLATWREKVPESFRFVLKASRRITHMKRLNDVEDELEYLLRTTSVLGSKLAALLFQLPPNMKKDRERLARFLSLLPETVQAAFEFRNDSWFDADVQGLLRDEGRALCWTDSEEGCTEMSATADWLYLRLRRDRYADGELAEWAARLRAAPQERAIVFFKHETRGPALAGELLGLVRPALRTKRSAPAADESDELAG